VKAVYENLCILNEFVAISTAPVPMIARNAITSRTERIYLNSRHPSKKANAI
jgi:NADPH-dependent 7-cyano-7-deazaguanine reductase QueF-like protein